MNPRKCANCGKRIRAFRDSRKLIVLCYSDDAAGILDCLFFDSVKCSEGWNSKIHSIMAMDELYRHIGQNVNTPRVVKKKQKTHAEKGFSHIPLKFEELDRIDALKLPGEKRPDVIRRLLELAKNVNTKEATPKVSTSQKRPRKKAVDEDTTPDFAKLKEQLVQKRKEGKNPRKG